MMHEANAIATAGAGPSRPIASATIVNPADRRMRPVRTCTWSPSTPSAASVKNSQTGRQSAARRGRDGTADGRQEQADG